MKSASMILMMLLATSLPPTLALAEQSDIKLNGAANLNAETCAKGTGSPDCAIELSITGKAAKVIYDGMVSKGAMQECTGDVEKFDDSGMHCIKGKDASGYVCDFSYAFKKHAFGPGPDGC